MQGAGQTLQPLPTPAVGNGADASGGRSRAMVRGYRFVGCTHTHIIIYIYTYSLVQTYLFIKILKLIYIYIYRHRYMEI